MEEILHCLYRGATLLQFPRYRGIEGYARFPPPTYIYIFIYLFTYFYVYIHITCIYIYI